jgi:trehalose 6-phosphate synthase
VRTLLDGAVVDFEEGAVWWQGHRTQTRAYPISISVSEERKMIASAAGRRVSEQIKPLLRDYTIMRVDRIEPTKNIVRGFQAYHDVLEKYPEFHGKVTFLAFLVPSRQTLPAYRRFDADVRALIGDINNKYGTDDWTPIQAFFGNDRIRALAAMRFYDVLLVNPIIDGMNLVAKEGAIVNEVGGVLVLSRTAGAFQQLAKGSIPTSPTDVFETAQALHKALTMPAEERRIKAQVARQAVERHDLTIWIAKQIRDINDLLERSFSGSATTKNPNTEPAKDAVIARLA